MQIKDITGFLESIAPLSYQESYDNSGLIVGDRNATVKKGPDHTGLHRGSGRGGYQREMSAHRRTSSYCILGIEETERQKLCRAYCDKSHKK